MQAPSFYERLTDNLLRQDEGSDPEIRALSLATLYDDDLNAITSVFWTQLCWIWGLLVTGWLWIIGFVLLDLLLFVARRRLRQSATRSGRQQECSAPIELAWIDSAQAFLIAACILTLTQAASDQTSILAILLAVGTWGFTSAILAAFPTLARINMALVALALCLGLCIGYSDLARKFAILSPFGMIAFWGLVGRTHQTLLGSIREQKANRLLSLHDPLTKLPNRAFMRETLARQISTLDPGDGHCCIAVLFIDLDGFKEINDRHGHAAGDWVLIHVADILRKRLSNGDFACRLGGDEYVVSLRVQGAEDVEAFGSSLIAAIGKPFDIGLVESVRVGASIGAAIATERAADIDVLLAEADQALYAVKRSTKGQMKLSYPTGLLWS